MKKRIERYIAPNINLLCSRYFFLLTAIKAAINNIATKVLVMALIAAKM